MKKFTIPCQFGSVKAPFDVYIGTPSDDQHPLMYQNMWLMEERGGAVPPEVYESFGKLHALSMKNEVSLEDLCVYALEAANTEKEKVASEMKNKKGKPMASKKSKKNLEILADPQKLYAFFKDSFYLLFLARENRSGQLSHAILLLRTSKLKHFLKLWEEESTLMEHLLRLGFVEHHGKGELITKTGYQRLVAKYHPEKVEKISGLIALLNRHGITFEHLLPFIFLQKEKERELQQEKVAIEYLKTKQKYKIQAQRWSIELQENPNNATALLNRGYAFSRLGRFEEALNDFDNSLALERHSYAFNNRGLCKLELGDLQGAYTDIQQSLQLDSSNAYAHKNLGKYYIAQSDFIQAFQSLLKARSLGYTKMYGAEVDQLIEQIIRNEIVI